MAATWPMAGAPRTIMSRMACGAWAADLAGYSSSDVGQLALVDDVQGVAVLAERRPEAGRGGRRPRPASRRRRSRARTSSGRGSRRRPRPRRAAGPGPRRRPWPRPGTAPRRTAGRSGVDPGPPRSARRGRGACVGSSASAPLAAGSTASSSVAAAGSVNRACLVRRPAQYLMTLVTRRPSSRSRPLRNSSSTRKPRPDDLALQPLDQLDRALDRAAGRQQVVDDEDLLAGLDRVAVDLEGVRPVLEGVLDGDRLGRQLAQLADRDEAGVELVGHRGAEDEARATPSRRRCRSRSPTYGSSIRSMDSLYAAGSLSSVVMS